MRMVKRITIKEVAKEAGFSAATVSGVLNGSCEFPDKTRKAVWAVANRLNYTPNKQARNLRSGASKADSGQTGIILNICHLGDKAPSAKSFQGERALLLAQEAEKKGLYPIPYWYRQKKGFHCPPLLNGTVDGALLDAPHIEIIETFCARNLPVVLVDLPFFIENSDIPVVNLDFRYGFMQLFTELKKNGHNKIGLMNPLREDDDVSRSAPIVKAILDAAQLNGLGIRTEWMITESISPENHDRKMQKVSENFYNLIKEEELSAIVCPETCYTASLYENFEKMGLSVPHDVSLAGLYSGLHEPDYNICSVMYNWEKLLATSLAVLSDLLDGKALPSREFLILPDFFPGHTVRNIHTQ